MQPPIRPGAVFEPLRGDDPPLVGGYRVLARIGAGRTGPVLLATTQSGRALAIKVAGEEAARDAAFRRRFKQEIAGAQRARGRYLVQVVDGHAEAPVPWVAAEYVPGPALPDAVAEAGPLPVPAVRALIVALAEGLRTLHEADLVHGDLRASSVLLAADGPRLADHSSLEHPAAPPDDVFGLGAVALHAATGRSPLPRPSQDGPPDLTGCPDELRDLIERCLGAPEGRPAPASIIAELEEEPPGPGWLPPAFAELLPAYAIEPAPEPKPEPKPEPAPQPGPRPEPAPKSEAATAPKPKPGRPNFAVPLPPAPPVPPPGPPPAMLPQGQPVMGPYRHDLAIALGIGGAVFGALVLVLLFAFML
ncbi:protein kinase [Actinomadura sp. 21ATH]|uniref:protein kinase domain-containing protein n=1 Tax=Actinomadura sp. 21ATH TaxID=1735444 RepID=UPI0035C08B85